MDKKLQAVFVKSTDSIKKALEKINETRKSDPSLPTGIVLVVDDKGSLIGIATDGDIRRAIYSGISIDEYIYKIMNKDPFLIVGPKSNIEILSIITEKIREKNWHKDRLSKIIIVDKDKKPIDLISFYDLWQKSDVRFKHIGVVGLGYVGLTLALTLSDLGFKIRGFDVDKSVSEKLKKGRPHFFENGIDSLLKDNLGKNFEVVEGFNGKNNCDVYFVAVGTPLDKKNKPNLDFIKSASETVGRVLKNGDIVILRSTVPIGTTRNFVIPILEKISGLKAGNDFFVAFAPERTIEGKALEELRKLPQVIGGVNWVSSDIASNIFSHMTHSIVLVDSLEEAEMVKLINNTYRDVVFSFANEVSLVARKFGISSRKVIEAANRGYDRSNVPMPSPGVGGACLEKDPFIFIGSANKKGYDPLLARDSRKISDLIISAISEDILSFINSKKIKNPSVFIMGFAFKGKPATSDIRGSTSIHLINKLKSKIKDIKVFDPVVSEKDILKYGVKNVRKIKDGFKNSDVVVVMNNHTFFESINIRDAIKLSRKKCLLLDCWGLYNKDEVEKEDGIIYKSL